MAQFSLAKLFGMTIRESANDGSDFTNPDADYRRLFLGEDGFLHVKDSAGAVTDVATPVADIVDLPTAEMTSAFVLAPDGAGGVEFRAETGAADILDIPTAETDDTLVLAPDGVGGVEFRAETGGASGVIDFDTVTITGGSKTINSTTWVNLDTGMDLTLTAATGDKVVCWLSGLVEATAAAFLFFDCATWVSGAGVHWMGSGEPTTSTGNGVGAWVVRDVAQFNNLSGSIGLVLQAGDISAGTVTLRLRCRVNASSRVVRASTTDPLTFQAMVLRP